MKREAVQEERQRNRPDNEVESSTPNSSLPVSNQLLIDPSVGSNNSINNNRILSTVNNGILNSSSNNTNNNNNIIGNNNILNNSISNNNNNGGLYSSNNNNNNISPKLSPVISNGDGGGGRQNSVDMTVMASFRDLTLDRLMSAQKAVEVRPIYVSVTC